MEVMRTAVLTMLRGRNASHCGGRRRADKEDDVRSNYADMAEDGDATVTAVGNTQTR